MTDSIVIAIIISIVIIFFVAFYNFINPPYDDVLVGCWLADKSFCESAGVDLILLSFSEYHNRFLWMCVLKDGECSINHVSAVKLHQKSHTCSRDTFDFKIMDLPPGAPFGENLQLELSRKEQRLWIKDMDDKLMCFTGYRDTNLSNIFDISTDAEKISQGEDL